MTDKQKITDQELEWLRAVSDTRDKDRTALETARRNLIKSEAGFQFIFGRLREKYSLVNDADKIEDDGTITRGG